MLIDGEEESYIILGNNEGDYEKNIISCNAPISKAVLGKKVGESIIFNDMKITILHVKKV